MKLNQHPAFAAFSPEAQEALDAEARRVAMMDSETANHPIHPWVGGSMMTGDGAHVVSAHCWICTGTDRPQS